MEIFMSRVAELQARIKEAQAELEDAKESERADALKRIKEEIKFYDFKATDFKGLLKSRVTQKQVDDFLASKAAKAKKAAATKKTAK
jgi:polyphosphate kinase